MAMECHVGRARAKEERGGVVADHRQQRIGGAAPHLHEAGQPHGASAGAAVVGKGRRADRAPHVLHEQ